ncbi:MAG: FliO/MopB family protein [bacterium]|nr:FliO/MopB family protein [bacterium]
MMRFSLAVALALATAAGAQGLEDTRDALQAPDARAPVEEGASDNLDSTQPPPIDLLQAEDAPPGVPGEPGADSDPFLEAVNKELDVLRDGEGQTGGEDGAEDEPAGAGGATDDLLRTFARVGVALCLVVAGYLIVYYLLKRFGRRSPLLAGSHLGTLLGRVHLAPRVALHFVRIRDRVLVVGVTPTSISGVGEFDAALFEEADETETAADDDGTETPPVRKKAEAFLAQLRESAAKMDAAKTPPAARHAEPAGAPNRVAVEPEVEDDEIAALRDGILRLQQQIQDTSRELDE